MDFLEALPALHASLLRPADLLPGLGRHAAFSWLSGEPLLVLQTLAGLSLEFLLEMALGLFEAVLAVLLLAAAPWFAGALAGRRAAWLPPLAGSRRVWISAAAWTGRLLHEDADARGPPALACSPA